MWDYIYPGVNTILTEQPSPSLDHKAGTENQSVNTSLHQELLHHIPFKPLAFLAAIVTKQTVLGMCQNNVICNRLHCVQESKISTSLYLNSPVSMTLNGDGNKERNQCPYPALLLLWALHKVSDATCDSANKEIGHSMHYIIAMLETP